MKSSITFLFISLQLTVCTVVWQQSILLNAFKLPIIILCQKYPLLLDTGSKDTWIADNSCKNCPQKINICPQSHTISHQIAYFKGNIKGDLSFLTTCLGSYKIICATQAQGMQQVGAMGILGLRGNNTGKNIIKSLLSYHNIKQQSFALYYGFKENTIFFGDIPQQYIKEQLQLVHGEKEWHLKQSQVTIWGFPIEEKQNHQIFVDTGSNVLILPNQLYQKVRNITNTQMGKLGCLPQLQYFQYICPKQLTLQETMLFKMSKKSLIEFKLTKTMVINDGSYKFLIQSGDQQTIIIGGSLLRDYILSFNLDGTMKIFKTKKDELYETEINNFKIILAQYLVIVILLAFTYNKLYQIAQLTLNRKIVI